MKYHRMLSPQPDTSRSSKTMDPESSASHSDGVPLYLPANAATKLHCLVTEAHVREQLAFDSAVSES